MFTIVDTTIGLHPDPHGDWLLGYFDFRQMDSWAACGLLDEIPAGQFVQSGRPVHLECYPGKNLGRMLIDSGAELLRVYRLAKEA